MYLYKKMVEQIYQIQIYLRDIKPKIWRRILVKSDLSLLDFHKIIQTCTGWTNFHLHQFTEERVIITRSLTDNCCSFLSEWFSYRAFKFLAITIRFCFQHSFNFVSTILQTLLLNKWPLQTEYTLEIKNGAWIDNECRVNRG